MILTEITNDAGSLLPLMIAIFAAKFTGDLFNASLFDRAMSLAGYPFLEPEAERKFATLTAEDVMTAGVISLQEVCTPIHIHAHTYAGIHIHTCAYIYI